MQSFADFSGYFKNFNNSSDTVINSDNRWVKVDIEQDEFLKIIFKDSCKGIPIHLQDKTFEPFFTTKVPSETGLGLSISNGIMEDHLGILEFSRIA